MSAKLPKTTPIYVVGPTASGKSRIAIEIAKRLDGVIVSCDSMQIYKKLDIGTAKETAENRALVDHRMIDFLEPDSNFSVAEYAEMAKVEIENIQKAGKTPIIVGGTGLYFESLIYPYDFSNTNKDEKLREELTNMLELNGAEFMHAKLAELDPESAQKIHPNNTKKVVRALEIVMQSNQPKHNSQQKPDLSDSDIIMIGLNGDRSKLYDKINARVDAMFDQGLVQEVYSIGNFEYQSMQAIGYKEFSAYKPTILNNKYTLTEYEISSIKDKIKQHTRNYAKRQITWFKRYKFVGWFEPDNIDDIMIYITNRLKTD